MITTLIGKTYRMKAYNRLLDHNIKPSMQRISIMEYLMTHRTHPSAEEIYTALSPSMPTLSKTTVYNTLKLFAENGAALMLTIDERNANFDGDTSLHAHFLCRDCGKIYDLECPESMNQKAIEGHQISEFHAYYKGSCKSCLKNKHID